MLLQRRIDDDKKTSSSKRLLHSQLTNLPPGHVTSDTCSRKSTSPPASSHDLLHDAFRHPLLPGTKCRQTPLAEQVFDCGAVHAEHYIQAMQEEFIRRFKALADPEQMAGGEERGNLEEWEEEQTQTQRAASGRDAGAAVGFAVDLVRHQDAHGESGGGGNLNTPRNGLYVRQTSRSPRGRRNKMEEERS